MSIELNNNVENANVEYDGGISSNNEQDYYYDEYIWLNHDR